MAISFVDKVCVITGAGRGLGRAYALEIARRGGRIVVNDPGVDTSGQNPDPSIAQRVAEEIVAKGGEAVACVTSISEPAGANELVDLAITTFGQVDVLINNAGFLSDRSFRKMTLADITEVIGVHLLGTIFCTHAVWSCMQDRQFGRLVFTGSAAGLYGNFGQANYSAAKMGVIGLMNTLKLEGAKYNIFVNTVAPLANTRLAAALTATSTPIDLPMDTVVAVVTYLCSAESQLTGQIIEVGGTKVASAALVSSPTFSVPAVDATDPAIDAGRLVEQLSKCTGKHRFEQGLDAVLRFISEHLGSH